MSCYIRLFTDRPSGIEYPSALAYSIHMAAGDGAGKEIVLNRGCGILYAEGVIREDNTIAEKGVSDPQIMKIDGGYLITAKRVDADNTADAAAEGRYLCWLSHDLKCYEYRGLIGIRQIERMAGLRNGSIIEASDKLEIPELIYAGLMERWMPVHATGTQISPNRKVSCRKDLEGITAKVIYSDGSEHEKPVLWDMSNADFSRKGTIKIQGKIQRRSFDFPLAKGYADPIVFSYEGKWYFLATNDNTDDIGIFVRSAETVEELFRYDTPEYCILARDREKHFIQTFWAPEFHIIGGRLYILFAVSPETWGPQCYMMRLREGGCITEAGDWEEPVRVTGRDGTPLCTSGITLDMTFFRRNGKAYLVWSERYCIGTELDSGSMLYIAETDEEIPWMVNEPVLISRPLYGWENQEGTINNEGPYALDTNDKLYIAFSGGSACGFSYVVGFLELKEGCDPLDRNSWIKSTAPELSAYSAAGEYGPGHNGFFKDENGDVWITYHAKEVRGDAQRCTAIRRVHFGKDNRPILDMSAQEDLPEKLEQISTEIEII